MITINEITFVKHLAQKLEHSLLVLNIRPLLFYFKIIVHSFNMYLLGPLPGLGI